MLTPYVCVLNAGIAQLVEQLLRNEKVVGSIPISGTIRALPAIRLDKRCWGCIFNDHNIRQYFRVCGLGMFQSARDLPAFVQSITGVCIRGGIDGESGWSQA